MIARLFLLVFFCSSFIKPGTLQWSASQRLSWSNFKAMPPANAGNAALTSSGILMSFSTNGEDFRYELSCNFDENSSWGRVQNDYILSHEQGHFDIAEIYTRKLNKALKGYRYKPGSLSKDVNKIYRDTMHELQDTQENYDRQTNHSRNSVQQKEWLLKIRKALSELQAFSAYK